MHDCALEHSGDRSGGTTHLHWISQNKDLTRRELLVIGAYGFSLKKLIDFTGHGLDPILIVYDRTDDENIKAIMVPYVLTTGLIKNSTFVVFVFYHRNQMVSSFYTRQPMLKVLPMSTQPIFLYKIRMHLKMSLKVQ